MKKFSKLPMRVQFLSMALLLVIIVPILIIVFYNQSKNIVIDQNIDHSTEISSVLQNNISKRYTDISNLMLYTGYHGSISEFLNADTNSERYHASKDVADLFQLIDNTQTGIYDIYITDNSGRVFYQYGYTNIDLNSSGLENNGGQIYYDGLATINTSTNTSEKVFVFRMNIFSDGSKAPIGHKIGYLTVLLDANFINLTAENLPNLSETGIFLIERDNNIFTRVNSSGLTLTEKDINTIENVDESPVLYTLNGNKYLFLLHPIPEIEGKIITATKYEDLISGIDQVRGISILLFTILVIVIAIPMVIMVHNFVQPLNRLMDFMFSINEGNLKMLKQSVKLEGCTEIEAISEEFNQMLRQINSLNQQLFTTTTSLYQQEIEAQKLQNAYLQSQINPHFLFNTLDSIKGIALASGNREIYKIASSFSSIFQYSTSSNSYAYLKEELKAAEHYLSIISIRFSDRISYKIDCSEELYNQEVPRMILQPVIEHTVTHELEPLMEGGNLLIQVSVKNDTQYEINIIDNGVGMDEQEVILLNEALKKDDVMSSNLNTDFENLHSINLRMKIAYGNEYGISVMSEAGKGMRKTFLLPRH